MRFDLLTLASGALLASGLAAPAIAATTTLPPRTIACDRILSPLAYGHSTSSADTEIIAPFFVEECGVELRTISLRGEVGVDYALTGDGFAFEGTFTDFSEYLTVSLASLGDSFEMSVQFDQPGRSWMGLMDDATIQQYSTRPLVDVAPVPLPAGLPLLLAGLTGLAAIRKRLATT